MKTLTVRQVAELLSLDSSDETPLSHFCVDSRQAEEGSLFFALPGASVDGHSFLEQVATKKIAAAVVDKGYRGDSYGLTLFFVGDVLEALQTLASHNLSFVDAKTIAITGSVGKTTVKEFLKTLLSAKYRVFCTPGNQNSQIGLPLAILNGVQGDEEVLILEMGMTEPGQIAKLVSFAPPDIALVTAIAAVHVGYLGTLEGIAETKAEIFSHPKTQLGIVPKGVPFFEKMASVGTCKKVTFSTEDETADYFLRETLGGLILESPEKVSLGPLPFGGKHRVHNFLGALAVAREVGLDLREIKERMELLTLPEKRGTITEIEGITFVDDSYNATYVSMKAALENLPSPKDGGKKIAVLGDMTGSYLEFGSYSEEAHELVGKCALELVDHLLCLGKGCFPLFKCWQEKRRGPYLTLDRKELVSTLSDLAQPGDVVLLKGSNKHQLWKVLDEIKEGKE